MVMVIIILVDMPRGDSKYAFRTGRLGPVIFAVNEYLPVAIYMHLPEPQKACVFVLSRVVFMGSDVGTLLIMYS